MGLQKKVLHKFICVLEKFICCKSFKKLENMWLIPDTINMFIQDNVIASYKRELVYHMSLINKDTKYSTETLRAMSKELRLGVPMRYMPSGS